MVIVAKTIGDLLVSKEAKPRVAVLFPDFLVSDKERLGWRHLSSASIALLGDEFEIARCSRSELPRRSTP